MQNKSKMPRHNRSLEERRLLLFQLYENWKTTYSWMFENYQLPEPRKAPLMANIDLSQKKMGQVPIPELKKSVMVGTILGDTSFGIQTGYRNPRMQNRHSTRQASWFFWKWFICLRDFNNGLSSVTFQDSDGFQGNSPVLPGEILGKLKINSKANGVLQKLHSVICENSQKKRKKIERSWLNHMNDYFLMTLWLDDGSLTNNRQGELALDLFSVEEQEIFVDYLKAVWDIECYVYNTKEVMRNGLVRHRIKMKNQENLLKLLRIVARIVPVKEMLYKILFIPENNIDLLQRWASEVSELVYPEFKDYIVSTYNEILENSGNKASL